MKEKHFERLKTINAGSIAPLLKYAVILILALFLARYLGNSIFRSQYLGTIILAIGCLALLVTSLEQKYILFVLTVFLPLYFPRLLLSNLRWIEFMGPVFCILLVLDILIHKREMYSKRARLFFSAVTVIFLWSVINYMRNPVSAGFLGADVTGGGMRMYLLVLVGITTFLASYWFIRYRESQKLLKILFGISLVLSVLVFIDFFVPGFNLPFLRIVQNSPDKYESFYRISKLSEMSSLGIISLLVLQYKRQWTGWSKIAFLVLFLLLVFSGARAMFIGTFLAIILYFSILNRKYFMPLLLSFIVFTSTFILVESQITLPGQLQRVTRVQGGVQEQDKYRSAAFSLYLEFFADNPVFGKGIGYVDPGVLKDKNKRTRLFITKQLIHGGHGSYLSILAIYGLGGLFFLAVMLFGSMYHAYKIFRDSAAYNHNAKLALFAFLYLVMTSVNFYVSGNGVQYMELWFLAGMVAGTKVKVEEVKNESK